MIKNYSDKSETIILLPCAGGSNCGQIANQVAVSLDVLGMGRICCLAGIGAHIEEMLESARSAERIVAIDGCQTACARKMVEHAGLKVTDWLCVTREGISENHRLLLDQEEIELITKRAKKLLERPAQINKR